VGGGGGGPRAFLSKLMLAKNPLGNVRYKRQRRRLKTETKRETTQRTAPQTTTATTTTDSTLAFEIEKVQNMYPSRKKPWKTQPSEDATLKLSLEERRWREQTNTNNQKATKDEIKSLSSQILSQSQRGRASSNIEREAETDRDRDRKIVI
jgi:hypothetical protein